MELRQPDLTAAASLQVQDQLYHVSTHQQTRRLILLHSKYLKKIGSKKCLISLDRKTFDKFV
jgi:hypothetical protein